MASLGMEMLETGMEKTLFVFLVEERTVFHSGFVVRHKCLKPLNSILKNSVWPWLEIWVDIWYHIFGTMARNSKHQYWLQ